MVFRFRTPSQRLPHKQNRPRPPTCNGSNLALEVCQRTRFKRTHETLSEVTRTVGVRTLCVDAITSLFVTKASDTLRTNPVEPQSLTGHNTHMRGTATYELCNQYTNMLFACNLSNNEMQHSPRTHVLAVNNQPILRDSLSNHASDVAELRHRL